MFKIEIVSTELPYTLNNILKYNIMNRDRLNYQPTTYNYGYSKLFCTYLEKIPTDYKIIASIVGN
jgi:hypothetical protein